MTWVVRRETTWKGVSDSWAPWPPLGLMEWKEGVLTRPGRRRLWGGGPAWQGESREANLRQSCWFPGSHFPPFLQYPASHWPAQVKTKRQRRRSDAISTIQSPGGDRTECKYVKRGSGGPELLVIQTQSEQAPTAMGEECNGALPGVTNVTPSQNPWPTESASKSKQSRWNPRVPEAFTRVDLKWSL